MNNPGQPVDILETIPESLHRAYLCTIELKNSQALFNSAFSPRDREAQEHNINYWKRSVSRQICEAFKMDNNLRFADLDSLAAGDELLISVIRSTLKGII
jgi:hypothetical protein